MLQLCLLQHVQTSTAMLNTSFPFAFAQTLHSADINNDVLQKIKVQVQQKLIAGTSKLMLSFDHCESRHHHNTEDTEGTSMEVLFQC